MSVSLYRRYRPRNFDEVAGQETVVDVLKKALQREQVAHAWLFSGPRGCGKTSAARLLAKALNCTRLADGYEPCGECEQCLSIGAGDSLDVVEIDGASNNGVEEIRELKTHVALSPFSARWKVYIIDEVHMLSISAFNALLKTLEEPPSFVVFILATTEPHKVPVTIRSRCQHIPFHRIGMNDICARLELIAEKENVGFDSQAIREIARHADGALRDALSLMEQAISLGNGEVSMEAADRLLGGGTLSDLEKWVSSLKDDTMRPFLLLEEMFQKGASPQRVTEGIFLLFRNLWAVKRWGRPVLESLSLSESETDFLCSEEKSWREEQLSGMMHFCSKLIPQVRSGLRSDVLSGLLAAKGVECRSAPFEESSAGKEPVFSSRERKEPPVGRSEEKAAPPSPGRFEASVPQPSNNGRETRASRAPDSAPPVASPLPEEPRSPDAVRFDGGLSESGWRALEKHLFDRNLLLYCLLADTSVALADGKAEVRFPEDAGYSFGVLSSERNSHIFSSEAAKVFGEEVEILLLWKDRSRLCAAGGAGATENEDVSWNEPPPAPYLFKPPEGLRDESVAPEDDKDRETAAKPENGGVAPSAFSPDAPESLPFEGLVNEVLKWSEGEVIFVKKPVPTALSEDVSISVDESIVVEEPPAGEA